MKDNINDSIKSISRRLDAIKQKNVDFSNKFSFNVNKGLPSFENNIDNTLTTDYYIYASSLYSDITAIEKEIININSEILKCDLANSEDKILLCDNLMSQYDLFIQGLSALSEKCDRHIQESKGKCSPRIIYSALIEFDKRLHSFINFISSIII